MIYHQPSEPLECLNACICRGGHVCGGLSQPKERYASRHADSAYCDRRSHPGLNPLPPHRIVGDAPVTIAHHCKREHNATSSAPWRKWARTQPMEKLVTRESGNSETLSRHSPMGTLQQPGVICLKGTTSLLDVPPP